jgi:predicted transcriptional regulator
MAKSMTLRLTDELAADLEAIARVENVPIAEEVRRALSEHIAARRKDRAFQARLRASLERNREILERLADR